MKDGTLSSYQLSDYLNRVYKKIKSNVIPIEDLQKMNTKRNQIIIINLHEEGSLMGHWVVIVVLPHTVVYFDPFGTVPPTLVISYMKQFEGEKIYSKKRIQKVRDTDCGWIVLKFLDNVLIKKMTVIESIDKTNRKNVSQYTKMNKKFMIQRI